MDAAEFGAGRVDGAACRIGISDIAGDRPCRGAQFSNETVEPLRASCDEYEARASRRERTRKGGADSGRRSGDDRNLAAQGARTVHGDHSFDRLGVFIHAW